MNVTKSYLPPFKEYKKQISKIWKNNYLTNFGPLENEFSYKLKNMLNTKNLHVVTNGTTALQLALESLNIKSGDIITTPFTFIATISAIVWQKYNPIFVDINPEDFNIDVEQIEAKITNKTKAILAVHCFGCPCDVKRLSQISHKYKIPIIYDAAHCFGTTLNGKSIFSYGDISVCSLHATKVFHSVEGGLCIVNNESYNEKLNSIKNFGFNNNEVNYIGINAKMSELHAAMGLCVLNHFPEIIYKRKKNYELYKKYLDSNLKTPKFPENFQYNYIYFPVLFENEKQLLEVISVLNNENIYPKRYFYPCINEMPAYFTKEKTPVAHDTSLRIVCLPLDTYLSSNDIRKICKIINTTINKKGYN